tara:strand:- start:205 stop:423 length:219 start_codon:yes stop_codon:yes gene_type:complete
MKSSLTAILIKALFGKKVAKQEGVHESYWGKVITDVYPSCGEDRNYLSYTIVTNAEGNNTFTIDDNFELEIQ